ncbi:hypothetical protein [Pantoea sp. PGP6]
MQACFVQIAGLFSGPIEARKFYDEGSKELYLYFNGEDISARVFKNLGKSAGIEVSESRVSLGQFELFTTAEHSFSLRRDLSEAEITSIPQ